MSGEKKHVCVLGCGTAGMSFVRELRRLGNDADITVVDKSRYFFDKRDLWRLLVKKNPSLIVDRETFAGDHGARFVCADAERINFRKRTVYCKDKTAVEADTLVVSCGLTSRDLGLKGDTKEGFFYFSDIDVFSLRDYLSWVNDVIVYAATLMGIRLAFYLSFLGKEVKLFTEENVFFGEQGNVFLPLLKKRGVDVYEGVSLTEVVGERGVKAVKTSLPKVFSAQLVCADSGLSPVLKLLDFTPEESRFTTPYEDVFVFGDQHVAAMEGERVFMDNSVRAAQEGAALARLVQGEPVEYPGRPSPDPAALQVFLEEELKEEKVASLV